jgi:hypothetical protein
MGAFSGFLGGLASGAKGKQQPQPDMASGTMAPAPKAQPMPVIGQPAAPSQSATPHFQGLAPMLHNYIQQHQTRMNAAAAQVHQQALQDPNTTPEQRQYQIGELQKLGVAGPANPVGSPVPAGTQDVSSALTNGGLIPSAVPVQMPTAAQGGISPPPVVPVNLGQTRTNTGVSVMPNPGEWPVR